LASAKKKSQRKIAKIVKISSMNHPARKVLLFFFISAHFLQGIYSIEEQREEIFKERVD
jgi:hypothetical protein